MIGELTDAWDASVINTTVEVLVINVRTITVTDELTDAMVDVDTLDDVGIIVVAAVVIGLMDTLRLSTLPSEETTPFS